jgi:NAD(P)-dependent dehydrogenase (short-subunit alcohol dehydrogenase family)
MTATRTGEMLEIASVCLHERRDEDERDARQPIALMTGVNRGIGKEVARRLARHGYEVLPGARDGEKASATATDLTDRTCGADRALTVDVSDPHSIEEAAEQEGGPRRLDVLVSNAGIGSDFGVSGTAPDFVNTDMGGPTF